MPQSESSRPIAAVLSTFKVLEEVAQRQPVGVSEIARNTGMPKSTVQRCLVTLNHAGWLRVVDPERARWGVTTKPLGIGLRAAGEQGLREAAKPYLEELRDRTDETIHLSVRDGDGLIILARCDSTLPVRTYVDVGAKAPIYTSSGIAMLAHLPEETVDALIDAVLDNERSRTAVTRRQILREVEATKERGYAARANSWWRKEVSAVAAAVPGLAGRPIAAVAVSIPSSRFDLDRVEFWGDSAVDAAERIGKALEGF
nr:IclR family transcriptional regulator [Rhodococcus sp. (in: high G+C Gram-positive bacteria)]